MLQFVLRRIAISALVLWAGSVLLYFLVVNSGDPLDELRQSQATNREQQMAALTERMNLDEPWYVRYGMWLGGASKCLILACDLGVDRGGSDVNTAIVAAMGSSLRLVTLATVIAIVLGVAMGVLSAIRQYTAFDYTVTFVAFVFFSLPVFWAAVLLKQYGAIEFNNWIADPSVSLVTTLLIAIFFGLFASAIAGGDTRRRGLTFGITAVILFAFITIFDAIDWWVQPALGPGLVLLLSAIAMSFFLMLTTGLRDKKVLITGGVTLAVGLVVYFVIQPVLEEPNWWLILALAASTIVVGGVLGYFIGGFEKRAAMTVGIGTALSFGFYTFFDKLLTNWGGYLDIAGRPISTIGSGTPNFGGNFYETIWDWSTQLLLPTIVLTIISLASYSRYTRGSMLETLQQDYMRTARSKGVSERVLNTRHALRNALIPITTIVAFDFANLIGGAVVTERVFGWTGMGALFQAGLDAVDPNPVMAFYLVTGTAAVVMNMLADIAYASLDPRIRR
ncbi:ABC transporter permease subunit [Ornithinimicrobium sp. Arc0846-15]|nr:ABC transporter permease subunit [Ornithinimicrobium laminariae]